MSPRYRRDQPWRRRSRAGRYTDLATVGREAFIDTFGNDANDGLSEGNPKQTIAAGITLMRDGYADTLRLRRGRIWVGQDFSSWTSSGHSMGHPQTVTAYGTGTLPIVQRNVAIGVQIAWDGNLPSGLSWVVFVDVTLIEFV